MHIDYDKYPYPRKIRHHVGTNLYFPFAELTFEPHYYPPLLDGIKIEDSFLNKKHPDILDIGCGKSKFLLELTSLYPDKNILGFEIRKVLVEWLQNLVTEEKIQNCWSLWYTVVNGLNFINPDSIEKAFYLFPDPWPKKRQQNRRLFTVKFLEDIHRVLKKDGIFYLATDCDYVDEHHKDVLEKSGKFEFKRLEKEEWPFPTTNKENFCIKKNIPVFRFECKPIKD